MDFFDKLGEALTEAGRDVSQKAKDVSEIAKLKMDIKSKEDYVQKQYVTLGTNYYNNHKDDENSEDAEMFYLIGEALAEIARMKEEVLRIQGAAECPNCGTKVALGAAFCSNCGKKMNDMYEE
ncbi:MAG: zinc ribbon domain-containing protein [Roseburia sp.]|nr:zinc ribbon domain-containing protein [Roseburia sp.]